MESEEIDINVIISYQLYELERKAGVPEAQGINPYWYGIY